MTKKDIKITADLLTKGMMRSAEGDASLLGQEYFKEHYGDGEWIVSFIDVIKDDLLPLARKKHISLFQAMNEYADHYEEQDTSWYQMWMALTQVGEDEFPPSALEPL